MVLMLFQKKVDRALNWLKEKNSSAGKENNEFDGTINQDELEKHDLAAMIISALLVFGPILIVLIIILILVI